MFGAGQSPVAGPTNTFNFGAATGGFGQPAQQPATGFLFGKPINAGPQPATLFGVPAPGAQQPAAQVT